MKLAVRIFALGLFAAGFSAAFVPMHATAAKMPATVNAQFVSAAAPMPNCGPDGCTSKGGGWW